MVDHAELVRCVNACCDDHASAEDVAALESAMRDDPEAVRAYIEQVGVHTSLDWLVTSHQVVPLPDVVVGATRKGRASRRFGYGVLALGASLMLALWWGGLATDTSPAGVSTPAAKVTSHTDDARWVILRPSDRPEDASSDVFANETIHLTRGQLEVRFANTAEVTLTGPAVLQVLAPDRALAMSGRLTANVGQAAVGFEIDTPRAQVVDLGTRFGLEVDDTGGTDVVVFEGEVDIAYGPADSRETDKSRRIMRMGEGIRVDGEGAAQRIVSIRSGQFAPQSPESLGPQRERLITGVRDNIRTAESWNYYEIVPNGMREDALAYVDRVEHEWNGLSESGMPAYLLGGDYVKMFNHDKVATDFAIEVDVARPVTLYVLFDNRVAPPSWLIEGFEPTGDEVGLDIGPFLNLGGTMNLDYSAGVGPGVSIENVLTVWKRVVPEASTLRLGSTETESNQLNMYGIVATPLSL